MGGYRPAAPLSGEQSQRLHSYLRERSKLQPEYVAEIERGRLPGRIETNEEGWTSQPWYPTWLARLPPKRKADPFLGAKERRRVPIDPASQRESIHPHPMLSSDAETLAGAIALTQSGIDPDEIDLLLVSSLVPDRAVPLNASLVQHKLGLRHAGAYNVDTCCSSFITMFEMACAYVSAGLKRKVLIVASALDSHINDYATYYSPNTGDASVAGIVGEVEAGAGLISSHATSDGSRHGAVVFQRRRPELSAPTLHGPTHEQEFVTFADPVLTKQIAVHAGEDMARVVHLALGKADLTVRDVDFVTLHQPVAWAGNAWRQAIGVPTEKSYESFQQYGNVACASAPLNLLEAVEKGLIKVGDRVVTASSGVGENLIAVVHRISAHFIAANGPQGH